MSVRLLRYSRVSHAFLISAIFFTYFPGLISSAVVTLYSIQIFTTHELLKTTPTVYFQCKGENKTLLPDVTKPNVTYIFNGEESWQPLTDFPSKKCKRCGLYEKDHILSDDVFEEWELCPSDFIKSDGQYIRLKEKEFTATFSCMECLSLPGVSMSAPDVKEKGKNIAIVIIVVVLVSTILIVGVVGACKYWQKRKRQQDQARFLKLFEDVDDIEDELGLGGDI